MSASATPAATTSRPAAKLVWNGRYAQDIQPIFDRHCVDCHGRQRTENGLSLLTYEDVMRGTQHGPVVVPGSPAFSTLISVAEGKADLRLRMPLGERRLSDQELTNLVLWIEAGAAGN